MSEANLTRTCPDCKKETFSDRDGCPCQDKPSKKPLICPCCNTVVPAQAIAAWAGSQTSEAKAAAARNNGKLGGRPPKGGK